MDLLETVGVWEFIRFLITKGEKDEGERN